MSIEAMKQALNKAFQLGQRYWSWSDSEYSSHWKKADVAKAEFDKLVEETCQAIEQAEKNQFNPDWDAMAVMVEEQQRMAKRIEELEQYEKMEPVAWVNRDFWDHVAKFNCGVAYKMQADDREPLYTTPQPTIKESLTVQQAEKQQIESAVRAAIDGFGVERFAKAHAAPVQEPVVTTYPMKLTCTKCGVVDEGTLTVEHPQREWVGLTDEDKQIAFDDTQEASGGFWEFADAIEAKLKEKNT